MSNDRFRSREEDRVRQSLSAHAAYHDALDGVSRAECEVIEAGVKASEVLLSPEAWRRVLAGVSDWSDIPLVEVQALREMGWCCDVVLEHLAGELEAAHFSEHATALGEAAEGVRAARSRCRSGEGSLSSITARSRICAGELRGLATAIGRLNPPRPGESCRRRSSCGG